MTDETQDRWELFVSKYPRVGDTTRALEEFTALTDQMQDLAIRGAIGYALECERRGTSPQYVKAAHNWLREKLWRSYAKKAKAAGGDALRPYECPACHKRHATNTYEDVCRAERIRRCPDLFIRHTPETWEEARKRSATLGRELWSFDIQHGIEERLDIYEAHADGQLSTEQRDELLELLPPQPDWATVAGMFNALGTKMNMRRRRLSDADLAAGMKLTDPMLMIQPVPVPIDPIIAELEAMA